MPRYFLGVDVGATKTHALVADETGRALGFGEGGGGNPESVGYPGLTAALESAVGQALHRADVARERLAGAGFGIAGYDWPAQREVTLKAIEPLGLAAPVEIVNDTIIGLLAGAAQGWGVAVVAGTGCNCRGRDAQHREGRVTGYGSRFGEWAGAGQLVDRAIAAVTDEWSRRGRPTRLSSAFAALVGAHDLSDFIEGLTCRRFHVGAEAAPIVFRLAMEGDAAARETIEWAGRELGDLVVGVVRQLGFETLNFEVVLVGSLFNGGPLLIDPLRETIHAVAPGARLTRLTAPPVVGGVLLGMEQAGLEAARYRERLLASAAGLVNGGGRA